MTINQFYDRLTYGYRSILLGMVLLPAPIIGLWSQGGCLLYLGILTVLRVRHIHGGCSNVKV